MMTNQKIAIVDGTAGIGLALTRMAADAVAEAVLQFAGFLLRQARLTMSSPPCYENPYLTGQTLVVDGGASLT